VKTPLQILLLTLTLQSCSTCQFDNKEIDTGKFTLQTPCDWIYEEQFGIDSFVGRIVIDSVDSIYLDFDYSTLGYAGFVAQTPEDFAYWHPHKWSLINPFCHRGTTYTTGNANSLRNELMLEEGITDTNLVIVLPYPEISKTVIRNDSVNPVFNYYVQLAHEDSLVEYGVNVPFYVQNQHIECDTFGLYYREVTYPINREDGTTGIYIGSLTSRFSFNLRGYGLDSATQAKALEAFYTLEFTELE
jgi:hypothetical protein